MIKNSYQPETSDMANITQAFFEDRFLVKLLMWLMNITTVVMAVAGALVTYESGFSRQTFFFIVFAFIWLFYRKDAQKYFMSRKIAKALVNCPSDWNYTIDKYKLSGNTFATKVNIKLKQIPKVIFFKRLAGYLIPLPGFSNIGKFIWLPIAGFSDQIEHDKFLTLIAEKKLKLCKRR